MKRIANRGLALLMAVLMCVSLLTIAQPHAHAAGFEYVKDGKYIYNWGTRGEDATELSPNAEAFYTGEATYASLSQLSGGTGTSDAYTSDLYYALKSLMTDAQTYETSYDATRDLFQYTDCQGSGLTSKSISSFYSGTAIGPEWDSGDTWNREHTWPNSKGNASGNGENDIMMLRPTAKAENGSRGNKAYGESSGYYNPNSASNNTLDLRGDVARITLYVYTRWGNTSSMWDSTGVMESLDVLLKWMEQDPVDTWELGRNDSVQSITGTRNVYVDYPELAFLLFGAEMPDNMTTPSGEAKNAQTCQHNYVAGTPVDATCTAKGYTPYTCSLCGKTYNGDFTNMADHSMVDGTCSVCGYTAPVTKTVRIYYPAGTNYITTTASSGKLKGGDLDAAAVFTMTQEGDYYSFSFDGKYLTSGTTGNSLFMSASKTDYSLWKLEDAANGYYLRSKSAAYNGKSQYIEYYNNLFTTYGLGSNTAIYTFQLKEVDAVCQHSWNDATCQAPKTCTLCGATEGEKADHSYVDYICTVCGETDPNAPGAEQKITISFTSKSNRTEYTTSKQVWVENGITVTNNKASSTSNVGDYANPGRFYKGSEVTVAYPGMTKIEIACTGLENKYVTAWQHTASGVTVSIANKIVTITFDAPVDSYTIAKMAAQGRAYSMTVYAQASQPSCEHSWDNATCTAPKTCTKCGETEGEALGHSWSNATCTAPKTCSACGTTEGEKADHNYVDYICTVCGAEDPNAPAPSVPTTATITFDDLAKRTEISTSKQVWAENGITVTNNKAASTSDVNGKYYNPVRLYAGSNLVIEYPGMTKIEFTCSNATQVGYLKDSITVGEISTNGLVVTVTLPAAADTYTIAKFGKQVRLNSITVYAEASQPSCEHSWDNATCTAPKTCTKCGETEGEALGHSWSNATCTAPKTCSTCGATEGEALGHSYADGVCTVCGEPDPNACAHDWVDANCKAPKTCSKCGETEGEALGHRYISNVTVKPTCESEGERTYYCVHGCDHSYTRSVKATGHKVVDGTCTVCGKVVSAPEQNDPAVDCNGEDCVLHGFADLKVDEWYHNGIHYGVEKGLFQGMPGGNFEPETTTTRAQFVMILWRLEGCPTAAGTEKFDDVAADQWYAQAISWAASEGIVGGYGNGLFGVNDEVTREQLATLLYRYAAYKGLDVSTGTADDLKDFDDALQVQDYAAAAMQWACSQGLVRGVASGSGLQLAPAGSATRAQAATVLYRYCEEVVK